MPSLCHHFAGTIAWDSNILFSADSRSDPKDSTRFPVEFLNKLTPAGHHLYIKKGMVLMLLQSLSPKEGLCNSTRLIFSKATNILLYCRIASSDYGREEVLIPRIEIKHQDEQFIGMELVPVPSQSCFCNDNKKSQGYAVKIWESV